VAGTAELGGTIRAFSDSLTAQIRTRMKEIFEGVTRAAVASYELEFTGWNPVTVNDSALARRFGAALERVVGKVNVTSAPAETGAEDFAYFAREVPSFYFQGGRCCPGERVGWPSHAHVPGRR
jgi:amidohydrolase